MFAGRGTRFVRAPRAGTASRAATAHEARWFKRYQSGPSLRRELVDTPVKYLFSRGDRSVCGRRSARNPAKRSVRSNSRAAQCGSSFAGAPSASAELAAALSLGGLTLVQT